MYNGIGLTTPRGSGTNGHIQRNWAFVHPKKKENSNYRIEEDPKKLDAAINREPNKEILDHDRKRKVEVKCIEYEEILESQGRAPEEIKKRVESYRMKLMEIGRPDKPTNEYGRISLRDTHQIAQAQQEKNAKLRDAFNIPEYFVDGSSFDSERKKREELCQTLALQAELEVQRDKAAAMAAIASASKEEKEKRYALLRTPPKERSDNGDGAFDKDASDEGEHHSKVEKKKKKKRTRESSGSPEHKRDKKKKSKKHKKESKSKKKKSRKRSHSEVESAESSDSDNDARKHQKKSKRDKDKDKKKRDKKKKKNRSNSSDISRSNSSVRCKYDKPAIEQAKPNIKNPFRRSIDRNSLQNSSVEGKNIKDNRSFRYNSSLDRKNSKERRFHEDRDKNYERKSRSRQRHESPRDRLAPKGQFSKNRRQHSRSRSRDFRSKRRTSLSLSPPRKKERTRSPVRNNLKTYRDASNEVGKRVNRNPFKTEPRQNLSPLPTENMRSNKNMRSEVFMEKRITSRRSYSHSSNSRSRSSSTRQGRRESNRSRPYMPEQRTNDSRKRDMILSEKKMIYSPSHSRSRSPLNKRNNARKSSPSMMKRSSRTHDRRSRSRSKHSPNRKLHRDSNYRSRSRHSRDKKLSRDSKHRSRSRHSRDKKLSRDSKHRSQSRMSRDRKTSRDSHHSKKIPSGDQKSKDNTPTRKKMPKSSSEKNSPTQSNKTDSVAANTQLNSLSLKVIVEEKDKKLVSRESDASNLSYSPARRNPENYRDMLNNVDKKKEKMKLDLAKHDSVSKSSSKPNDREDRNRENTDKKDSIRNSRDSGKRGKPTPVVRLQSQSDDESGTTGLDEFLESKDKGELKDLEMLKQLKTDIAAKAKEKIRNISQLSNPSSINEPLGATLADSTLVDAIVSKVSTATVAAAESAARRSRSRSRDSRRSTSRSRSSRYTSSSSHTNSRSRSHSHSSHSSDSSSSSRSSSSSSSSRTGSRSPSIPRRRGSPSFLDRRRITRK